MTEINHNQFLYSKMVDTALKLYEADGPCSDFLDVDKALNEYDIPALEVLDKRLNPAPTFLS